MKKTLSLITMGVSLCGAVSYGLTASTVFTTVEIDTTSTYDDGSSLTYANGVLSGAELTHLTFDYKYGNVQEARALIYTGINSGNNTAFGLWATADGGITGAWKSGSNSALQAWTNQGTVSQAVFSGKDTNNTGSIKLTLALSTTNGVAFAVGDSVTLPSSANDNINGNNASASTTGDLYRAFGLKSDKATNGIVTLDTDYISKIYIAKAGGITTYTSNGISVVKEGGTHVNATSGRVDLNGGNNGSAASTSTAGNPIYVGGTGQLFLQTWNAGSINLNNDIYLGSSTHSDVADRGVLRFGNDGASYSTTLNGEIVVLENTSMKAGGTNTININGSVTDKKNIDGSASTGGKTLTIGGRGYTFGGQVNVSNLDFAAGTAASFTNGFTTEHLTLGNNVNLSSDTTLTISDLTVGTGVSLNAALTLSDAATARMAGALTLGDHALSISSLSLRGTLMASLSGLTEGNTLNLFTDVSSLTLAGTGYEVLTSADRKDLCTYFTGIEADTYYLGYENNTVYVGLMTPDTPISPSVPEPTTATLSLLALAGLLARRRRQ